MTPATPAALPVLAICVPTYNRASSLRNLFKSLAAVKARFGTAVEICISNNGSDDDTAAVIEEFSRHCEVNFSHQANNVGGTLNIIAVAQQMRAGWGLWCGDDDELRPDAIAEILNCLGGLDPDTWLLVDVADLEGRGQYMRHFRAGGHTAAEFRHAVLKSGLNPFGFMGVHVFPRSNVALLKALQIVDAQPWPHMAALLRHIMKPGGRVHVLPTVAIAQAKGGAKLFWSGGDLARIRLAKLRILRRAHLQQVGHFVFLHLLMLRELYSLGSIKALMAWKLYEPDDFNRSAVKAYLGAYTWLGAILPLATPHTLLMLLLRAIPNRAYAALFRLIGQGQLLARYQDLKRDLGVFDGIKRGI